MYDYVNFEMYCPFCGTTVDSFQSKDGECMLNKVDPTEIRNMYSRCPSCNKWIELSRKYKEPRKDAYTLDEVENMGFKVTRPEPEQEDAE